MPKAVAEKATSGYNNDIEHHLAVDKKAVCNVPVDLGHSLQVNV
jgi:hypothetical protein